MSKVDPDEIEEVVDQIKPLLAGRPSEIQGAILAECLSIWLAGHRAGSEDGTRQLRAELLSTHCRHVRELTPINDKIIDAIIDAKLGDFNG
jgi:hypothetical protein